MDTEELTVSKNKRQAPAPKSWQVTDKVSYSRFKLQDIQRELDCTENDWTYINRDVEFSLLSLLNLDETVHG